MNGRVLDYERQDKPLGRWACNIAVDGWFKLIDLSVAPRIDADAAIIAALRAEVARLQECAATWEHNWKSERDVKLDCISRVKAADAWAEAAEARVKELGEVGKGLEPHSAVEKLRLQKDAGIPHLPTDMTYEARMAISGDGPRAYEWSDKKHRLVYDLCREIERIAALASKKETVDE